MGVVWLLRVISGTARGLKLESLDGLSTRPTLDRVKESIFNILFDAVTDSYILDLFAGSGALGIESLSRGASRCTFVDSNKDAINVIKRNVKKASVEEKSDIRFCDYKKFISECNGKYDIVFLDPPYMAGFTEDILERLHQSDILNEDCIIVVESDKNFKPHFNSNYKVIKDKNYGRVNVCLLEVIWVE